MTENVVVAVRHELTGCYDGRGRWGNRLLVLLVAEPPSNMLVYLRD